MARQAGDSSFCPTCKMRSCDCGCHDIVSVIEPSFGWKGEKAKPKPIDWTTTNVPTSYTLPPLDKDTYSFTGTQPNPREERKKVTQESSPGLLEEPELEKAVQRQQPTTTNHREEKFYQRSGGCWCRDCPWLILYLLLMLIWLGLVIFCWVRTLTHMSNEKGERSSWSSLDENSKAAQCAGICSLVEPPTVKESEFQPDKDNFHCSIHHEMWEMNIFLPWNTNKREPVKNCVKDCMLFENEEEFMESCVRSLGDFDHGSPGERLIMTLPNNGHAFEVIENHWHWIMHVVAITNAISVFFLLVPLFFSCVLIGIYAICSILSASILMSLLWYDVWVVMQRYQTKHTFKVPSYEILIFHWACAIASTLFTCYVIINSVVVMKRYQQTCAVASLASKFVNSVPTILLEAGLTMILLGLWHFLVIWAIVGSESLIHYGNPAGLITWVVRSLTLVLAYWTVHLIINCQTIVIHGAMSNYYFNKDMANKVSTVHKRLIKYHVCTACFGALLFNWVYWSRWFYSKSIIRSRTLYGTGTYGESFCPASKTVLQLLESDSGMMRKLMSKPNPLYFLSHTLIVSIMAIVSRLCFSAPVTERGPRSMYAEILMVGYAYFVSLAVVNIYRVTKDAIFLSYLLDRSLSYADPNRALKLPFEETAFHSATSRSARVVPR